MTDPTRLSDEELRELLVRRGLDPGYARRIVARRDHQGVDDDILRLLNGDAVK